MSADRAATEAADREAAKLPNADRVAGEHDETAKSRAGGQSALAAPVFFSFDQSAINGEGITLLD